MKELGQLSNQQAKYFDGQGRATSYFKEDYTERYYGGQNTGVELDDDNKIDDCCKINNCYFKEDFCDKHPCYELKQLA